eukprot:scaffold538_cov166-Amphora_coffeaeformis.AAC.22
MTIVHQAVSTKTNNNNVNPPLGGTKPLTRTQEEEEEAMPVGVSHFPPHCLPWPGEDAVVEGSYGGFHLLLMIQQSVQITAAQQTVTPPSMICLWEYSPSSGAHAREIVEYLASQCAAVMVLHDSASVPVDLKEVSPKVRLWASLEPSSTFMSTLLDEMKDLDWLVIIPDNFYVILELLTAQLGTLSPHVPLAVPAGLLTDIYSGKPASKKPEPTCGWVYSTSAVQQVSNLQSSGRLPTSLLDSLRAQGLSCTVNVPSFTYLKITNYTTAAQWRRLHSAIHGTCNKYWNTPLGARDENGQWGYVHDPTSLKRHSHPLNMSLTNCETPGPWYDGTRKALSKVEISPGHPQTKRVLCMVYTHSNRHEQLRAIAETWGSRCDGFMAASNLTDPSLGAVDLWHEGPEIYGNMWLKVRSMWEYAHKNYLDRFDFFHIGGDDHYVIPENLRWAVSTGSAKGPWDHSKPLYLGGSLAIAPRRRYCGGGSGYTLNRVALDMLITELWNEPNCFPHWRGPDEDVTLSKCFRLRNIQCMDTNDELEETRWHPWDAKYHANWDKTQKANWYPKHLKLQGIANKDFMGQISKNSVSFHLKQTKPNPALPPDSGVRFYYALLYGKCNAVQSGGN